MPNDKPKSWRDVLPVHRAADLFPMMSDAELRELGEDIRKNGLKSPIAYLYSKAASGLREYWLVDGRNRLGAMETAGLEPRLTLKQGCLFLHCDIDWEMDHEIRDPQQIDQDPWTYVISANIHRRHLDAEQKRELIAELLKADPTRSDRQIAATVKASPTYVGKVRAQKEATGDVSTVDTRRDTKGREQPAHKADDFAVARKLGEKVRRQVVADRAEERSRQTQHVAEQVQKAAQAVAMPKHEISVSEENPIRAAWLNASNDQRREFAVWLMERRRCVADKPEAACERTDAPPAQQPPSAPAGDADDGIPEFLRRAP